MDPYSNAPSLPTILYYAAVGIAAIALASGLAAWTFWSNHRLFHWYKSIHSSYTRWESILLPPKQIATEIFWFTIVSGINALLIAGGVYLLGHFIHTT